MVLCDKQRLKMPKKNSGCVMTGQL